MVHSLHMEEMHLFPLESTLFKWLRIWDMALFEFGVNVIGDWTAEQLYDRSYACIDRIKQLHPGEKVIVTDMYYTHHDFDKDPRAEEFCKAVRDCVTDLQRRYDCLYYINGIQLMGTYQGLSSDGLHPSDHGHSMIAERLTKFINDEICSRWHYKSNSLSHNQRGVSMAEFNNNRYYALLKVRFIV